MSKRILIRRGLKSQIPVLSIGELGFCTDVNELFIGTNTGNKLLALREQSSKVSDSATNGYIIVDGVQLKVYDDSTLKAVLDNKANANHKHDISDLDGIDVTSKTNGYVLTYNSVTQKFVSSALSANNITQDSNHRFVTDNDKAAWSDKYTKNEVDTKINAVITNLDWKESVNTFADISTTYNSPVDGWTVNVKDTDTTYRYNGTQWISISANNIPVVTQSVDGKMSAADKTKLDNIEDNANNYIHPENHPANIIIQDTNNRFVTDAEKSTWNSKASNNIVTNLTNGLMSSVDKDKLDNIENNANNYIHPVNHPASIITEDSTHRFVTDSEKLNWNDKYTKSEVDIKIANISSGGSVDLSNYYNKQDVDTQLSNKVDSIVGKQLSTEDYSTEDKQKLNLIEDGANNYIHPTTHDATMINQDPTRRFVSDIEKAAWNAKADIGHAHDISDITNLQSTINDLLNRIASLEADVTNLKNGSNPSNTAPILTSSFNTTTINDSTALSIPYNISDIEGGDMTVTLTKDGVENTQTIQVGDNTWNVGTLSIGAHVLKIKVTDSLGLISTELTFNLTVEATQVGPVVDWTYDFIVPQNTGVYDLDSNVAWTHTLTNEDVYGPAVDGVNHKIKLLTLGVQDGAPNEPGEELPRDGFDAFTAPSMHGAYSYDADLHQIYFKSMAMNPYYFRIVKYV